jgi:DNA repair protein RecN (Recombination protein N)
MEVIMLSQLHIENVAVIELADLDLEKGFNVLTGETGAGKSILIDSINLVLGERVSKDIVRSGAAVAHVTALFADISNEVVKQLAEFGVECEEDKSLLISRNISADGRGTCRIAGRPTTVSMLRDIGRLLVNIHGQHDNQALLSTDKHIYYLDRYASNDVFALEYGELYTKMKQIKSELKKLQIDDAQKTRRIDLLRYQINDIESAALKEGEDEALSTQRTMILNAEKITGAVNASHEALCGGENNMGAQELVAAASSDLSSITEYYPDIRELAERIASLSYELDDCISDLRSFTGEAEYNPNELENIEQRLDILYRQKKKYGGSIAEVLLYLTNSQNELAEIEGSDEEVKRLELKLEEASAQVIEKAKVLTQRRLKSAIEMETKIKAELNFLEMPGVEFKVNITPLAEPSSNGADSVEFLISANPGSPLKPLAKIASGGEIARVMLGIKTVLADKDDIDTLIFDEIDTGVSGRAAQKIGMKLRQVAQTRQVVCVTHLAQIASQAERHIVIEKTVDKAKTFTQLHTLNFVGRKRELARIIGGVNITDITLQNAEEMLNLAGIKCD